MKKTKIMSTIAMVLFILSMLCDLVNETIYYVDSISAQAVTNYAVDILLYTLPGLLGAVVLIVGVKLAAGNTVTVVYPIGFVILFIEYAISLVLFVRNLIAYYQYANEINSVIVPNVIRCALMMIAFILLALDGFLLLKSKALGIIGAAMLLLISFVFLVIELRNIIQSVGFTSEIVSDSIYFWSFYSSIELIGAGALLYAIGRPAKSKNKYI